MSLLDTASGDILADRRADYAEMLMAEGAFAAAAELMLGALELAPQWAFGWFRLGEMHEAAGQVEAAVPAWRTALALDPSDRAGAVLKLALAGAAPAPDAPPPAFVETLFDQYAKRFDTALVDDLGYCVPELLFEAIQRYATPPLASFLPQIAPSPYPLPSGRRWPEGPDEGVSPSSPTATSGEPMRKLARAVDLGCGTGLMGERLRPIVDKLAGCDLSTEMLREARKKGIYDRLDKADLQDLPFAPAFDGEKADLVTAADVFMYLGRLDRVFAGVVQMLAPGGLFAFSVEKHDGPEDFVLRETRRFAHSEGYVRRLLAENDVVARLLETQSIRRDRNADVAGLVVLASLSRA